MQSGELQKANEPCNLGQGTLPLWIAFEPMTLNIAGLQEGRSEGKSYAGLELGSG